MKEEEYVMKDGNVLAFIAIMFILGIIFGTAVSNTFFCPSCEDEWEESSEFYWAQYFDVQRYLYPFTKNDTVTLYYTYNATDDLYPTHVHIEHTRPYPGDNETYNFRFLLDGPFIERVEVYT